MEFITKNTEETRRIGEDLAREISGFKSKEKFALVMALEGELGAGKTTFVQGFARGLKLENKITSPTFVLFKIYPIRPFEIPQDRQAQGRPLRIKSFFRQMIHVDCYRLRDHKDLAAIGFKEEIRNKENIILVEWSDRVQPILPERHIKVHIDHLSENERKITII